MYTSQIKEICLTGVLSKSGQISGQTNKKKDFSF